MYYADRVKQTTDTTGTGAYSISAVALPGYATWAAAIPDGSQTGYCVQSLTDYEVGIGTYNSTSNSLSRDSILASSNSGAAVDWPAGSKDIFCTVPAGALPTYSTSDPSQYVNPAFIGACWHNTTTGEQFVCIDNTADANIWRGQMGTTVGPAIEDVTSDLVYALGAKSGATALALVGDDYPVYGYPGYTTSRNQWWFAAGDYIRPATGFFHRQCFSISCFFSTTDIRVGGGADARRTICSDANNEFRLEVDGTLGGVLRLTADNGTHTYPSITTEDIIEVGTEYHCGCVYNAGYAAIYVNGVKVAETTSLHSSLAANGTAYIARASDTDRYLRGSLREFRLYDRDLTAAEFYDLYMLGRAG